MTLFLIIYLLIGIFFYEFCALFASSENKEKCKNPVVLFNIVFLWPIVLFQTIIELTADNFK